MSSFSTRHLGALLVSVCAGISGICRVLCGFIADHPSVNRLVLCGVSGIVAGALTAFSTLLTTFLGLVIIFGLIGIPSGKVTFYHCIAGLITKFDESLYLFVYLCVYTYRHMNILYDFLKELIYSTTFKF